MIYIHQKIKNFPKGFSEFKKNIINNWYRFGSIVIGNKKNALTARDKKNAKKSLRKGDVIICGALRRMHSIYIGGICTHALLYVGSGHCIHSIAHGVGLVSFDDVLREYDTLLIIRHPETNKKKIARTIEYAMKHIGKPFDFTFESDNEKIYCTELLYNAFYNGRMKLDIFDGGTHNKFIHEIPIDGGAIHPMDLLKSSFRVVFHSHNVYLKNKELKLLERTYIGFGIKSCLIQMVKFFVLLVKKVLGIVHYSN